MFEHLISVSGVGAKTALSMLDTIEPSKFALAVITDDIKTLTKIPGIGAKSAARIVLELKDKLKAMEQESVQSEEKNDTVIDNNDNTEEAISALQVLGYNKKEIEKALGKIETKEMSTEEIIKKGLVILST